ncbi:MAG: MATE family efflux transporter [Flavobacteriales bacterium]|nr:MATE family efflux transporter [Flavobacteriales bacterium]
MGTDNLTFAARPRTLSTALPNTDRSSELGTASINRLLVQQTVPASVGVLVMSLYMIVDTIFVGRWVGPLAIGAITVVMPVMFLISSTGMAIGIGGSSIISRALGAGNTARASRTFGNQVAMTVVMAVVTLILGFVFDEQILRLFGAAGQVLPLALEYYHIILIGVPFLGWAMMGNNVIRSQGFPREAMMVMLLPAMLNIILDPILMLGFDMGLKGAAWATSISYMVSATYVARFFMGKKVEVRMTAADLRLDRGIVKEINALGVVTLARQGAISLLYIVVNHALVKHGGIIYLSVFGIVNRLMMLALFTVLGLTQGILPIVGYNYGAHNYERVITTIRNAVLGGTGMAASIWVFVLIFREQAVGIFGNDPELMALTPPAVLLVFLATPIISLQMIGAAYFQAVGRALPALLLTLSRQTLFLIPLVLLFSDIWQINGVWYAFPVADVLSAIVTTWFLQREIRNLREI